MISMSYFQYGLLFGSTTLVFGLFWWKSTKEAEYWMKKYHALAQECDKKKGAYND